MATPDTVQQGDSGEAVSYAQCYLVFLGYLGGPPDVDGIFGPNTDDGVKKYQAAEGIDADGIVGPVTWGRFLAFRNLPPILGGGSSGDVVRQVQRALNHLAHDESLPWTDLAEDGDFGPLTEAGVRIIQGANQCDVDGVVGPQTWTISLHAAGQRLGTVVTF